LHVQEQLPEAIDTHSFDRTSREIQACSSEPEEVMDVLNTKYVVISPVRDESAFLPSTFASMLSQTVRPKEWILVDDGSKDRTGELIDSYARAHRWIRALHRSDRGFRNPGGGVVEAFNAGLQEVTYRDWQFIVKMDGDLSFECNYFEQCFRRFSEFPKLGIAGGVICYQQNGDKRFENNPLFHVRGATKIYKRECWEAIGGFWPAAGWDTVDEIKANRLGWETRSFPELHLIHHRHTGSANGRWNGFVKNGKANYICGYHPLFMLSKCLRRLPRKPYILGSAGLAFGFISGYLQRIPQIDDPETIEYLRRQQLSRLWGKESIWK
jgi:poly-beta-1,6-N-acetyl-D-glucosamine synthase